MLGFISIISSFLSCSLCGIKRLALCLLGTDWSKIEKEVSKDYSQYFPTIQNSTPGGVSRESSDERDPSSLCDPSTDTVSGLVHLEEFRKS